VVQNSVAAEVLAESIANAQFQSFATPVEALAAFSSGEITVLGGDSLWLKANQAEAAPTRSLCLTVPMHAPAWVAWSVRRRPDC